MSVQGEKGAITALSEYIYTYNRHGISKISTTGKKKLKLLFELSSLTILLAASSVLMSGQQSFSQLAGDGDEWLVYKLNIEEGGNIRYQIAVPYPATWTQGEGAGGEGPLVGVSDFFSPTDENGDYVIVGIWIEDLSSLDLDLEEYLDNIIDGYSSSDHEIISSDVGEFTLVGMPAFSLETTYADSEYGPQNMLEVGTIIGNEYAIRIQSIADEPIYEENLPIIMQIVSSTELSSGTGVTDTSTEDSGSEDVGDGRLLEGLPDLSRRTPGSGGGNANIGGDQIGGQGSIGGTESGGNSSGSLGDIFGRSQGTTSGNSSGSLGDIFGRSQ